MHYSQQWQGYALTTTTAEALAMRGPLAYPIARVGVRLVALNWSGREVITARALWRPRLPVPCCRCGRPVVHDPTKPHGGWQVDHWPIPREHGGTETHPAHTRCNLSAGGKRGAQITNARRVPVKTSRLEPRPLGW